MTPLASPLMVASWPWSAGELLLVLGAAAAAVTRHATLVARSDGDAAERERTLLRRGERRAAFGAVGRPAALVAVATLVAWLALASTAAERGGAWAFAVGVVVAAGAAVVVGEVEDSARARVAVAAGSSPEAASAVAWDGGLVAAFAVVAAQGAATWIVAATTDGASAPLGLAAGTALVAWFARSARAVAPATARAVALLSVQSLALAAAAGAAARASGAASGALRADLLHVGRILVALGGVAPLALRGSSGLAEGRPIARRILAALAALAGAGLVGALFVAPLTAFGAGRGAGWSSYATAILVGVALVAVVARVAEHAAQADAASTAGAGAAGEPRFAPPASRFIACLALAAALVVAAPAAGAFGVALAAAAAAAALPALVAAGIGGDLLPAPPVAAPSRASDVERAASSAAVALAGWALLGVARRGEARLDLLAADVAGGALVGVALVLFISSSAARRRGDPGAGANSTRADLRAMIVPALLAVAAPFCAARLNLAAAGGMAAGALLCGATAALLVPRASAGLLDRVVSLLCITFVLCAR